MKRLLLATLLVGSLLAASLPVTLAKGTEFVAPPAAVWAFYQDSLTFVRAGTTLPVSCSNTRVLFHLTADDGANLQGLYRCTGSSFTAVGASGAGTGDSVKAANETFTGIKSFADGKLVLLGSGSGGTTLKASAAASGTITFPAAVDTAALLAASQTFTNKTLGATNVFTLKDDNLTFQDNGDTTKQGAFQFSGITTGTTRTFTWPDANITIAGDSNTLTFTNKTVALGSNTVSGTTAQFNTALSDGDFATLAGSESLSNKTFVTPVLGVASATSINKVAITAPATSATLTIADGKTLTASNTLTFTGTDTSSVAFGTGGTVVYTGSNLSVFAATTSAQLAGVLSNETGSSAGLLVFNDSPTIVTPTIASFVNATHTHANAAGGGTLDGAAIGAGTVVAARLPATIAYTGQANTFGAFLQDLGSSSLKVPTAAGYAPTVAGSFGFNTTSGLPVIGNGAATLSFVTDSGVVSFTNKTLDASTNTVSNLGTSNFASSAKSGTGTKFATTNFVVPGTNKCVEVNSSGDFVIAGTDAACGAGGGGGDVTLSGIQTFTGAKTFADTKLIMAGATSGTTVLKATAIAGTTTVTFPAATDTVVLNAASATLTTKTIALGSNTVSGTTAEFNTANTDGDFATLAGAETLSAKTLTAPKFADGGFLADANGNELAAFVTTPSAVTYLKITPGATGTGVTLSADGETDADLILAGKGTGVVKAASITVTGTDAGSAVFEEADAGGTDSITVTAPAALSASFTQTLAAVTGTVAVTTGATATDDCAKFDSSGRLVSAGAACGAGGGGSGTITSGATNTIPKYTAATTVDDSLASDDGTTFAYSGTGGLSSSVAATGVLGLKDTDQSHYLNITPGSNLTADRTLTITTGDAARGVTLGGDIVTASSFTTSGANALILTTTGATNVTLPTTGTVATLAGSETLTNKTLTAPVISTISNSGTVTIPTGADTLTANAATQTLTNKRITKRVTSIVSNATWSPNADTDDVYKITAQAAAVTTINNPSGTPTEGQTLMIRVKDDGTARALTWSGTQWRASTDLALPTTTTLGKTMYLGFVWNATDSKWDLLAKIDNF